MSWFFLVGYGLRSSCKSWIPKISARNCLPPFDETWKGIEQLQVILTSTLCVKWSLGCYMTISYFLVGCFVLKNGRQIWERDVLWGTTLCDKAIEVFSALSFSLHHALFTFWSSLSHHLRWYLLLNTRELSIRLGVEHHTNVRDNWSARVLEQQPRKNVTY